MSRIRSAGQWAWNGVVWLLLVGVGVECSFSEVANGRYTHATPYLPEIAKPAFQASSLENRNVLVRYLAEATKQSSERLARTETKLRGILGLSGIVFALLAGLGDGSKWLSLVAATPLVFALLLALRGLGVHTFVAPTICSEEVLAASAENDSLDWLLIADGIKSINTNEAVADLIVDCVKASVRWFIGAMLLALLVPLLASQPTAPATCIELIRARTDLREILRGPSGSKGDPGSTGPRGPQGPSGPAGPAGSDCK